MHNIEHLLAGFDQNIYMEYLINLACEDGDISQLERNFIEVQANILGIDAQVYFDNQCGELESRDYSCIPHTTKMIILRDLIALANIDKSYSTTEQQKIMSIAEKLSLDKKDVEGMEDWLKEYWAVLEKGQELLGITVKLNKADFPC